MARSYLQAMPQAAQAAGKGSEGMNLSEDVLSVYAAECLRQVFENGASEARSRIDLGDRADGYCIEIVVRKLTDEEAREP
jgi:hypothetical protein